jgi:hypothetical protein
MKITGHTQLKTFLRYVNLTVESASTNAKNFGEFINQKLTNRLEIIDTQSTSVN